MIITLKERILTKPIVLQDTTVVIPERELTPDIVLQEKAITVMERVLTDSVKISGHKFAIICPADFGYTGLAPYLTEVDGIYNLQFVWFTGYDMVQEKVDYRVKPLGTWQYLGPIEMSGSSSAMNEIPFTPVRGNYEWYAKNENACGDWGSSTLQTFQIDYNAITGKYYIV